MIVLYEMQPAGIYCYYTIQKLWSSRSR